jgi:hypothetical protein
VNTLSVRSGQVASHGEPAIIVVGVEKVSRLVGDRGHTLVVLVDGKVFALVGERGVTVGDRVPRVPGDGESITLRRLEHGLVLGVDILRDRVGGKTRVDIDTDGVTLFPVRVGLREVLCRSSADIPRPRRVSTDGNGETGHGLGTYGCRHYRRHRICSGQRLIQSW